MLTYIYMYLCAIFIYVHTCLLEREQISNRNSTRAHNVYKLLCIYICTTGGV